jgi:hypothetical protein
MDSLTSAARPVKASRRKPARSVKLLLAPQGGRPGVLRIACGKDTDLYFIEALATDFGRGFKLTRKDFAPGADHSTDGAEYHVNLDHKGRHRCECLGFLRHRHCKHVEGLLALAKLGLLPTPTCEVCEQAPAVVGRECLKCRDDADPAKAQRLDLDDL